MTRLAVLADIHGNLPALEAVIADLAPLGIDHVIVNGDVINWGAFSLAVLERIHALGWSILRGNHEYYLLDYATPRAPAHWANYDTPRWLNRIIPPVWQHRIAAWPEALSWRYADAPPVRVVHAAPTSVWEGFYTITPEAEGAERLAGIAEALVIVGHTHLPMRRTFGRWQMVNPGSVGVPLDGDPAAEYAILEAVAGAWRVQFRRVAYDYRANLAELERLNITAELGATGVMLAAELASARPRMYPFNVWCKEYYPDQAQTVALAAEFLRTAADDERYMPAPYHQANLTRPVSDF